MTKWEMNEYEDWAKRLSCRDLLDEFKGQYSNLYIGDTGRTDRNVETIVNILEDLILSRMNKLC